MAPEGLRLAEEILVCHEGQIDLRLPPGFLPAGLMEAFQAAEVGDNTRARQRLVRIEKDSASDDAVRVAAHPR